MIMEQLNISFKIILFLEIALQSSLKLQVHLMNSQFSLY